MSYNIRKIMAACAIAAAFIILLPHRTFAEAQQSPAEKILQPQGLNQTGIYAIQKLDPNLTGSGVKFAVLCRSNTYVEGQPQNDYRPDISHDCFASSKIVFHDRGTLPAVTSPHSTAACSILLGSDPNAYNEQLGDLNYQGAAPQAKADVYEFWHFLINNVFPQLPPDGDIITASFGSPFDDWWTRGIESLADKYGLTVVASIGNGSVLSIPIPFLLVLGVAIVFHILLTRTKFGTYVFAVGGNENAARYSGIKVDRIRIATYMIVGLCTGMAATIEMSRMAAVAAATSGSQYEFEAITAVIVGGTSLSGGKGRLIGSIVGFIILGIVNNMMIMLNISPSLSGCVKGAVILFAVLMQRRER